MPIGIPSASKPARTVHVGSPRDLAGPCRSSRARGSRARGRGGRAAPRRSAAASLPRPGVRRRSTRPEQPRESGAEPLRDRPTQQGSRRARRCSRARACSARRLRIPPAARGRARLHVREERLGALDHAEGRRRRAGFGQFDLDELGSELGDGAHARVERPPARPLPEGSGGDRGRVRFARRPGPRRGLRSDRRRDILGRRVVRVDAGDHGQQQRRIGGRARHRARDGRASGRAGRLPRR